VTSDLIAKHLVEWSSDSFDPILWLGDGPIGQVEIPGLIGSGTGPKPVVGRAAEVGVDRISLDIVGYPVESAVALDRISPKAILVNGAAADGRGVTPKSHCMGGAKPVQPLDDLLASIPLDQKVPVVRHDAERKKAQGKTLNHFFQAGFESEVVRD